MELRAVNPKKLKLNPDNPRRTKASPEADAALAANIKAIGLIQPPFVRELDGKLVVKAGERRVKASIAAGLAEIHVIVASGEDEADPLRSLAENVQRAQMGPVDQWRAIEALCGGGWTEEAIGTAFTMPVRTIRKLRLLASIHPAMLDRMAYDLPSEENLRKIAAASLEDQEAAWKTLKPKRGHTVQWFEVSRALHKDSIPATHARFDDETARTYGVLWVEDLFGPADEDNRTTSNVEEFFAAQQHWLEGNLPENGVILEAESYGGGKLPPRSERCYGQPREGDKIGFFIDPRTGKVSEVPFREIVRATSMGGAAGGGDDGDDAPRAPRPPISRKGVERIGDLRTDALHQGLREAEIDDTALLGLLVLALAGQNVSVQSAAGGASETPWRRSDARGGIARRLIEGGHLTSDLDLLRGAARDMLVQVLSCREGVSQSGVVARVAGDAIGADAFIANMAEDEFLKTLSKVGIEDANRALGIQPRNTGKEMRAALIQHVGQGSYVLPAACFGLTTAELEQLQERIADDAPGSAEPPDPEDADSEDLPGGDDDLPADGEDASLPEGSEPGEGDLTLPAFIPDELPEQRQAA